jgi:acetyl esterase/lipase
MFRLYSLVLFLVCLPCATADDLSVERDVVYGNAGEVELKLDLFKPAGNYQKTAGLLLIHGGGWQKGDKSHFEGFGREAAKRGYVCASINYRHAPRFLFPAQVEDVKCAARWMRDQAHALKIEPSRIGAVGASAGAHLAMMLGVMDPPDGLEGNGGHASNSSKVQAVVSLFGPTNLTTDFPPTTRTVLRDLFGGTREDKLEAYRRASPITYVSAGDAPMLLYQGTKDSLVPYEQAIQMATALTNAVVSGRVELLLGTDHGWGGKELERTTQDSLAFFDEKLKLDP